MLLVEIKTTLTSMMKEGIDAEIIIMIILTKITMIKIIIGIGAILTRQKKEGGMEMTDTVSG
jgi:hypothetical protein